MPMNLHHMRTSRQATPKSFFIPLLLWTFFISGDALLAQIKGKVTDENGEPLPAVSVYLQDRSAGTITNDDGIYLLEVTPNTQGNLVFKYLGYTTETRPFQLQNDPLTLDIGLRPQVLNLDEVEVSAGANPGLAIIKKAIARRKAYLSPLEDHTADFYSKGLIKIKNAPERILGQTLGDFGGGLDSTRTGILYLSETVSTISVRKGQLNETISASKVSGDDNGFSFNTAADVDFLIYRNTVEIGNKLISPIADNALGFYSYELLGTYYDENNNLINTIAVRPKRENDKTFSGTIYIIEDFWAVDAVDLYTTGNKMGIAPVDTLRLKQNYRLSKKAKTSVKQLQSIDFRYSILGFKGDGRFTAAYGEYHLDSVFPAKAFNKEVLRFADSANTKGDGSGTKNDPFPLQMKNKRTI